LAVAFKAGIGHRSHFSFNEVVVFNGRKLGKPSNRSGQALVPIVCRCDVLWLMVQVVTMTRRPVTPSDDD
jgi:hypothetical protein